jgi:hypothetical protein
MSRRSSPVRRPLRAPRAPTASSGWCNETLRGAHERTCMHGGSADVVTCQFNGGPSRPPSSGKARRASPLPRAARAGWGCPRCGGGARGASPLPCRALPARGGVALGAGGGSRRLASRRLASPLPRAARAGWGCPRCGGGLAAPRLAAPRLPQVGLGRVGGGGAVKAVEFSSRSRQRPWSGRASPPHAGAERTVRGWISIRTPSGREHLSEYGGDARPHQSSYRTASSSALAVQ